jgi:hypothetical protein
MLISSALSLASLAAKAGSGIVSAIRANKERKHLQGQMNSLDDWYNAESNQDYVNTDQAQSVLSKLRETLAKNKEVNNNTAAVMGGTAEAQIAANQGGNDATAQTLAALAAQDTNRDDALRQQYVNQKESLSSRMSELRGAQIQGAINAGANAMGALGSVTSADSQGAFGDKQLFGGLKKIAAGNQSAPIITPDNDPTKKWNLGFLNGKKLPNFYMSRKKDTAI